MGPMRTVRVRHGEQHLPNRILQPWVIYTSKQPQAASKRVRSPLERSRPIQVFWHQPLAYPCPCLLITVAQPSNQHRERRECVIKRVIPRLIHATLAHVMRVWVDIAWDVMFQGKFKEVECALEHVDSGRINGFWGSGILPNWES
jgi:hypothetical protein